MSRGRVCVKSLFWSFWDFSPFCELASEHCSVLPVLWVGDVQGEDGERLRVRRARDSLRCSALVLPAQRKPFSSRRVASRARRKQPEGELAPERADSGWNFVLSGILCACVQLPVIQAGLAD